MKVIQEGDWKKKHTCRNCGTKFEYNLDDVRYGMYSTEYEDAFEGKFYVACPRCGKQVIQRYIPDDVGKKIREERED